MDSRISSVSRPDVVMIESAPRPTPMPDRVTFSQVLAAGASGLVQGAELVANALPGSPVTAAAVRGGAAMSSPSLGLVPSATTTAEGPSALGSTGVSGGATSLNIGGVAGSSTDSASGIDASLQQSAQQNLYYLQIQQQVDSQNRSFTALSNVLKTEHDSAKAAIQNIHS